MASSSKAVAALKHIEHLGNKLPHPTTLFIYLCVFVIIISAIAQALGLQSVHPQSGASINSKSLLSVDGLHYILTHTVKNFTDFAPLGTVLVAMLGIGIAEKSGLLGAVLRMIVLHSPQKLLTLFVVFTGVLSSLAADAGYVVLIPLAALLFASAGRHPLGGIAAAFAGVSGGYSANLLIGPLDVILSGISTESVQLVANGVTVSPLGNYYFIIASTFLVTLVATLVTEKLVLPSLEDGSQSWQAPQESETSAAQEKLGLRYAAIATLVIVGALLYCTLPENAVLRNPQTGSLLKSPFISGIVTIIALSIAIIGIAYGKGAQTFKQKDSVVNAMEDTMATMAGYLVLMFFAAQFVNYFNWSNLGLIFAVKGAGFLQQLDTNPAVLLISFILVSAMINLFIGSSSAKWSIMGPVFVPMLFLLGISPEAAQMAYRIGDSTTNIITPLMPYFAIVVAFAQRWDKESGIGTLLALMIPYSIALLFAWMALLGIWIWFELPLGPGVFASV